MMVSNAAFSLSVAPDTANSTEFACSLAAMGFLPSSLASNTQ